MTTPDPAAAPAEPQATPQPAEPQIPAGQTLVSEQEYESLKRMADGYKGQTPALQALGEMGLKTPEDIKRFGGTYQKASELGIDLDRMMPDAAYTAEPAPNQQFDVNKFREEILSDIKRETATGSHEGAVSQERGLVDGLVTKVSGKDADEDSQFFARAVVNEAVMHASSLYPAGHPLAGQVKPLSPEEFATVESVVTKRWASVRGQQIAEIASNAANATPAPGAGTQGAATAQGGQDKRPDGRPSKEAILAAYDKSVKARGGTPISGA